MWKITYIDEYIVVMTFFFLFSLYRQTDFQYQLMEPGSLSSTHQGLKWIYLDYLIRVNVSIVPLYFNLI